MATSMLEFAALHGETFDFWLRQRKNTKPVAVGAGGQLSLSPWVLLPNKTHIHAVAKELGKRAATYSFPFWRCFIPQKEARSARLDKEMRCVQSFHVCAAWGRACPSSLPVSPELEAIARTDHTGQS